MRRVGFAGLVLVATSVCTGVAMPSELAALLDPERIWGEALALEAPDELWEPRPPSLLRRLGPTGPDVSLAGPPEYLRLLSAAHPPEQIWMVLTDETVDEVQAMAEILGSIARGEAGARQEIDLVLLPMEEGILQELDLDVADTVRIRVDAEYETDDLWLQDWGEVAVYQTDGEARERLVLLDAQRGRGLPDFAEHLGRRLRAPVLQLDVASEGDYGGNIEVTPDQILFLGDTTSTELQDYLEGYGYADQTIVLQTSHLVVGHVDELVTFLPAPDTPLGYVVLMADPVLGWELLGGVDPTESLSALARAALEPSRWRPRIRVQDEFIARAIFDALENLLSGDKAAIRRQVVAAAAFEENLERIQREIPVARDELVEVPIIRIPTLYGAGTEEDDPEQMVSLLPEATNMLVLPGVVVAPDPLLPRFREHIAAELNRFGYQVFFLPGLTLRDGQGQLHCATHAIRDPTRWVHPRYAEEGRQRWARLRTRRRRPGDPAVLWR
jgi:hypothetical protein